MGKVTSRSAGAGARRTGWLVLAAALLVGVAPLPAVAADAPAGRPRVTLDRLELPDVPNAARYRRGLEPFLRREARRVDWGADRKGRVTFRFQVTELTLKRDGNVLRVSCSAVGRLPGNRAARGHLEFGGDPEHPNELVDQVLRIVARGVVSRLAELERKRRGLN